MSLSFYHNPIFLILVIFVTPVLGGQSRYYSTTEKKKEKTVDPIIKKVMGGLKDWRTEYNGIAIFFKADDFGLAENNCLNEIEHTYPTLFDTLTKAAKNAGAKSISIGYLDYTKSGRSGKKTGSHYEGRAVDVSYIDNSPYARSYERNKFTNQWSWSLPEQPEIIKKFEKEFLAQKKARQILGPWYYNREMSLLSDDKKIDGVKISDLMGALTESHYITTKFEAKENTKSLDELKEEHKSTLEKRMEITTDKIHSLPGYNKIDVYNHFEHRHHGHIEVKQ